MPYKVAVRYRPRVHGPRRVLLELRRLLIKNNRSLRFRAETPEARMWSARVRDLLAQLIAEGDVVLPGATYPRDARRVRKRPS